MLNFNIQHFDSLASTNTEAARQAALGVAEGLCVVAREQTAGRGRQGRAWESPKDAGLYFSIVLRPRLTMRSWPLITLIAALAVHDALVEACALVTDIKWPNDILSDGRKLCGILAETVETERGRACVVGVGINLDDRAFPPELSATAVSIASRTERVPDAGKLLRALTQALRARYSALQAEDGVGETLRAWTARSTFAAGRRVRVTLANEVIEGQTRGLEPDGALRVETDGGEIRIVRAGDVAALRSDGHVNDKR